MAALSKAGGGDIDEDMDCENMDCESAVQQCEASMESGSPRASKRRRCDRTSDGVHTSRGSSLLGTPTQYARVWEEGEMLDALRGILVATADMSQLTKKRARRQLEAVMGKEEGSLEEMKAQIGGWVDTLIEEIDNRTHEEINNRSDTDNHSDEDMDCESPSDECESPIEAEDFENLSVENRARAKHICVQHLDTNMIDPSKDLIVESAYMTGKTTMVHKYIKENNRSVLVLSYLCSLHDASMAKFADCDVLSYKDKNFRAQYRRGRSIVITLDSLMMLQAVDFHAEDYVVYLDEIHSIMTYLNRSTTLAGKRMQVMTLLVRILRNAKQLISTDNDICDVTVDFLLKKIQRQRECQFVMNSHKSYAGVHVTELTSMVQVITKMHRGLIDGEMFTTCCNEKRRVDQIAELLKEKCKEDGIDPGIVKVYTATEGGRIKDINKEWAGYSIIYSPVIVTGLDYNPSQPTTTFTIVCGTNTLSPEEVVQQAARNRNMSRMFIYFEGVKPVETRFKSVDDIKDAAQRHWGSMCSVYQELCGRVVSECGDQCKTEDNIFTDTLYQIELRRHKMACGFKYHTYKILRNKGFVVDESDNPCVGFSTDEKRHLDQLVLAKKERKIEAVIVDLPRIRDSPSDDVFEKTMCRRAEILCLPLEEEQVRRFKEVLFEDKAFQQHLNVKRLLLSKEALSEKLLSHMRGDFAFNAAQGDVTQVATFCAIVSKCFPGATSVLDLQLSVAPRDAMPEGVLGLWKELNPDDAKNLKKIPKTKKQLIKSLFTIGKHLFGYDYWDMPEKPKKVRRDGERFTITTYSVNKKWRDKHLELFKYSVYNQNDKLDEGLVNRYGLYQGEMPVRIVSGTACPLNYDCPPDPTNNFNERIQEHKNVGCKTLEESELEQIRSELWTDLAQRPIERVCAPAKDKPVIQASNPWTQPQRPSVEINGWGWVKVAVQRDSIPTHRASQPQRPKRAPVSDEDHLKKMRAEYKRIGVKIDF